MIRGGDFDWRLVDADGVAAVLDAADIESFDFRWGGFQNRRRAPSQFRASGDLVLNRIPATDELESYRGLTVDAGGERYFDLIVSDFQAETGDDSATLMLQSRGAAEAEKELRWGLRPSPSTPAVTFGDFTVPGAILLTEQGAPVGDIRCLAPPDPDGGFYETSLRRVLAGIESLGFVLLLEDVSAATPTWRGLPMPLVAESDHRVVTKRFSGFTDLIMIDTYRHGVARHWAADKYVASVGGSPFQTAALTLNTELIDDVYDFDFPYDLGVHRSSDFRARVWTASVASRFAGFYRLVLTNAVPSNINVIDRYISPDGRYAGVVSRNDRDDVRVSGELQYYVWDEDWDTSERTYYANGKDVSEKRTLGNKLVTIYDTADNLTRLQRLINRWDEWAPHYARMQFLVEDLMPGSPAGFKPGDRIGLDVSDLSHHAVIIGARWRLRGNRPLRITWDIVTQEEIPDLRVYVHDVSQSVSIGSEENEVYLEV